MLKEDIKAAVDERCVYLQSYFFRENSSGKTFDDTYVSICDMLNLSQPHLTNIIKRGSFNFTMERVVPLSLYMMDNVLDTGRTSIQECWCGNAFDFDAPRSVDLFAHLYASAGAKARADVTSYIKQHRRRTLTLSKYNEEMYCTVVLETVQSRTKEICEDNPFCRRNLNETFAPVCFLQMMREVSTGQRDVKDIYPRLIGQRIKLTLVYACLLAPVDYFLIPDYADHLLPYMIFHYPDGTPYRIMDCRGFRDGRSRDILCQFASMETEYQDVALTKLLRAKTNE